MRAVPALGKDHSDNRRGSDLDAKWHCTRAPAPAILTTALISSPQEPDGGAPAVGTAADNEIAPVEQDVGGSATASATSKAAPTQMIRPKEPPPMMWEAGAPGPAAGGGLMPSPGLGCASSKAPPPMPMSNAMSALEALQQGTWSMGEPPPAQPMGAEAGLPQPQEPQPSWGMGAAPPAQTMGPPPVGMDQQDQAQAPVSRVWDPATGKYVEEELPPEIQALMSPQTAAEPMMQAPMQTPQQPSQMQPPMPMQPPPTMFQGQSSMQPPMQNWQNSPPMMHSPPMMQDSSGMMQPPMQAPGMMPPSQMQASGMPPPPPHMSHMQMQRGAPPRPAPRPTMPHFSEAMLREQVRLDQERLRRQQEEEEERERSQSKRALEDYQERYFLEQLAEKRRKLEQKAKEKEEKEREDKINKEKEKRDRKSVV